MERRQVRGGDMGDVRRKSTPGTLHRNQKHATETELKHTPDAKSNRHQHHHSDIFSYTLPSHSETLFNRLQSLWEEKLLLDCTFTLKGNSFHSHRIVLAASSQTPNAFIGSKQMSEAANCLSPIGLRAALEFAYTGRVAVDLSKEGVMEEVLNACQCLGMERLMERCTSKVTTSVATERDKSIRVIKDMWERGVGCDITIQAETGESYSAHRVVVAAGGDYFRALLCGGLRESREDVVCLRGVPSWVIESILRFIYTGQLRLSWNRVWEITDALIQFQLEGALSLCINFLQERMDESTCLDVLVLAENYGLVQLGQAAEEYTLAHFQCISGWEKIKDIPCPLLDRLLEKDSLCVESEIVVFRTIVSWVEDNLKERLPCLPGLLLRVRIPLLNYSDLQEALSCSLLYRSPGTRVILKALKSFTDGHYKGPECRPRTANQVLVLVGGDTVDDEFQKRVPSQMLWFAQQFHRGPGLIRSIDWKQYAKVPEPARFRHCVCLLNNKLYILGGRKYYGALDILKSAVRFDLTHCKWELLPDMLCQRDYFSAVCVDGKVFAIGGNRDDSQYQDTVEYYTPEENTWRPAHPLKTAVCGHAAAVLDGQIYISGGCDPHHSCLSSMWNYHPSHGCFPRAPMTAGAGRAGHIMLAYGRGLVVAGGLQPFRMGFEDQLLWLARTGAWTAPAAKRKRLKAGSQLNTAEVN
ncbi:kelch-like protein 33 isoform X2 [Mugil cephalus]|uniref:kelch-like protein 33 isoform X2 n=1 Tax=Mugil cephalus TaxID=48193 RepID=UPI001FB5D50C|nr:kelch-like protein 33 isoform X2 [Mugil cephalus]